MLFELNTNTMNKIKSLIIIFILSPSLFFAQTFQVVKDKNKIKQLEREVWWSKWDGHSPGWFYWLIELTQDDDYRDKDRRNMLQLLPIVWMTNQSKQQSEKEKEAVDEVAKQKLFILADLEIDYAYEMVKGDINNLRYRVGVGIQKALKVGVYPDMMNEINREYTRIEGRIYTLRKSDLTNADRQKGYESEIASFRKLIVLIDRITIAFEAINKK
jgi:hypothetical protein